MPLSGRPPPLVDGPPSLTSPAIQRPYQVSRYPHTWRQVWGYPNAGYKHICEALGVAWSAQATKLTQSKIFKDHIVYEDIVIRGLSQHLACPRGRRYPSRSIFASARFTCRPRGGWGFRWYAWQSRHQVIEEDPSSPRGATIARTACFHQERWRTASVVLKLPVVANHGPTEFARDGLGHRLCLVGLNQ
jgi:hypothetical protein